MIAKILVLIKLFIQTNPSMKEIEGPGLLEELKFRAIRMLRMVKYIYSI